MRFDSTASRRPRRLALGITLTAALAGTLAACSSSSSTTTNATATQRAAATHSAAAAPSAPASAPSPAAAAGALSGRWSGQYSGAYNGTFNLRWRQSGSILSGTIHLSNPGNSLSIRGKVSGGAIQFGTVGGGVGVTYTGSVSGSSMSGTYKVQAPGGPVGGPWSANRS